MSLAGLMRISLLVAIMVAAALVGSLFARTRPVSTSSPVPGAVTTPTSVLPTSTREAALTICQPDDHTSACLPEVWDRSQNLADPGNGAARPAVSKDAQPAHTARYVNDGRGGTSWVSNSPDSWIKIDLGQVSTIHMVTLEKGDLVSRYEDLGQFVIAVALVDVYADGDSSNDDKEYAQVFHSEQADFSGTDSHTGIISIRFSPVEARFVKITFERAGAAIEEVGVFMVEPSGLAEQPTSIPQTDLPGITLTPTRTSIWLPTYTSTSVPDDPPTATDAPSQPPTTTPQPSNTPTPLPTGTQPPADTATPVPTDPLPTEVPPTAIPPTASLPTVELSSASTEAGPSLSDG